MKVFSSYCDCSKLCFVSLGCYLQVLESAVCLCLVSFYVATTLHSVCVLVIVLGDFHVASVLWFGGKRQN